MQSYEHTTSTNDGATGKSSSDEVSKGNANPYRFTCVFLQKINRIAAVKLEDVEILES